jgi:hypothetical protein
MALGTRDPLDSKTVPGSAAVEASVGTSITGTTVLTFRTAVARNRSNDRTPNLGIYEDPSFPPYSVTGNCTGDASILELGYPVLSRTFFGVISRYVSGTYIEMLRLRSRSCRETLARAQKRTL